MGQVSSLCFKASQQMHPAQHTDLYQFEITFEKHVSTTCPSHCPLSHLVKLVVLAGKELEMMMFKEIKGLSFTGLGYRSRKVNLLENCFLRGISD